jgi:hypothetical protein
LPGLVFCLHEAVDEVDDLGAGEVDGDVADAHGDAGPVDGGDDVYVDAVG